MPRDIPGAGLHYLHGRIVVESPTGENLANATLVFTHVDTGAVLQARDTNTDQAVTLTTNARGETPPSFRLPVEQAIVTAAGGQPTPTTTTELGAIYTRTLAAETAAESASASAAQIAASFDLQTAQVTLSAERADAAAASAAASAASALTAAATAGNLLRVDTKAEVEAQPAGTTVVVRAPG